MNIYLIRHGEMQPGGTIDTPGGLSCIGVFQAKCLGSRLTQYQIEGIYTSDEACSVQTTEIINRYLTVDIMERHELKEIDMGSFLRGWAFINEFHPAFWRNSPSIPRMCLTPAAKTVLMLCCGRAMS